MCSSGLNELVLRSLHVDWGRCRKQSKGTVCTNPLCSYTPLLNPSMWCYRDKSICEGLVLWFMTGSCMDPQARINGKVHKCKSIIITPKNLPSFKILLFTISLSANSAN